VTTAELKASSCIKVVKAAEVDPPLTPDQERTLADCAERITALGRKSTEQTFEYGEELAIAQGIVPAKKFGQWLSINAGMSTKSAKNFTRVYKELAAYRDRLVKSAVGSTAMFALLGADDQAIEGVLDRIESGERVTVSMIKTMVGTETKPEVAAIELLDTPGRDGCMKIAMLRMNSHVDLLFDLLGNILVHVEEAVTKFEDGKRVTMKGLADAIEYDARHANDLFGLTLAPLYMDEKYPNMNWKSSSHVMSSAWGRLQVALHKLGGFDSWPAKDEFRTWIVDEVYSLLKFAVRGEALTGVAPMDSERPDVAAEAAAIHAAEQQRALKATRVRLDRVDHASGNIVELASRQKAREVEHLEA